MHHVLAKNSFVEKWSYRSSMQTLLSRSERRLSLKGVGGDSCLRPVLSGGGAATFFIAVVARIDSHEYNKDRGEFRELGYSSQKINAKPQRREGAKSHSKTLFALNSFLSLHALRKMSLAEIERTLL